MKRSLVVTRPEPEASLWTQTLRARGFDALAFPLIAIAPPLDLPAVVHAHENWSRYQSVMFVSSQAVAAFFKPNWPLPQPIYAQAAIKNIAFSGNLFNAYPRCWATGPGTRQALLQVGVPPTQIDAPDDEALQFDSEALWRTVATQVVPGQRVLLVRGGNEVGDRDGRDWLAQQLLGRGAQVDSVLAYRRCPPTPDAALLHAARQATGAHALWLFTSSQAIVYLQALWANPGLADRCSPWADTCALATHPRIAQAARGAGFAVVYESRPTQADVIASIESIA
jgi:uroporphyrinogen-III synthase